MGVKVWSRSELELLFDLRAKHGPIWIKLKKHFPGRSSQQLAAAYTNHRDHASGLLRNATAAEIRESAIAARDRRADLAHQSLTAAVFGDPLPGRSALDKKHSQLSTLPAGRPASMEA